MKITVNITIEDDEDGTHQHSTMGVYEDISFEESIGIALTSCLVGVTALYNPTLPSSILAEALCNLGEWGIPLAQRYKKGIDLLFENIEDKP